MDIDLHGKNIVVTGAGQGGKYNEYVGNLWSE